ncbi:aldo/keto reductase [Phanerochaete sordida]|uniref:Aldo/keto reductase n=1 Tax=Phanerochaete sordida TaxID=48140 RepID=A0A9P3LCZ8_9APHY|nr:aldo/keto reductase [Phanerochaete sordida]
MEPPVPLNDGTLFPWPAYGSGTALRDTDASTPVASAIRAGFRHIDCAQMYKNEASVGRGIASALEAGGLARDALYVTTKLLEVPPGRTAADTLRESLRLMGLECVDLFLVHEPVRHSDLRQAWREMEECKMLGLAKRIGVSNFRVQDLEEIATDGATVPVINQIEFHPYIYEASKPVLAYMHEHGILPTSYGGLTPLVRIKDGPLNPVLVEIADRLSTQAGQAVTEAQVLQLWMKKKGVPYTTTTSKPERLQEYLQVASLPGLSDADEQLIDTAGASAHHRFFCKWIDDGT